VSTHQHVGNYIMVACNYRNGFIDGTITDYGSFLSIIISR